MLFRRLGMQSPFLLFQRLVRVFCLKKRPWHKCSMTLPPPWWLRLERLTGIQMFSRINDMVGMVEMVGMVGITTTTKPSTTGTEVVAAARVTVALAEAVAVASRHRRDSSQQYSHPPWSYQSGGWRWVSNPAVAPCPYPTTGIGLLLLMARFVHSRLKEKFWAHAQTMLLSLPQISPRICQQTLSPLFTP